MLVMSMNAMHPSAHLLVPTQTCGALRDQDAVHSERPPHHPLTRTVGATPLFESSQRNRDCHVRTLKFLAHPCSIGSRTRLRHEKSSMIQFTGLGGVPFSPQATLGPGAAD